ncbi:MAG: AMP-binding protein [Thiotrichaceae bacterium]|nr:AMP-binding protein [Thiotrichaceae bacterium]
MEKIWLESYQHNVPEVIDANEYSSLLDVFKKSVERFSSKTAFINHGQKMTYAELDQQSKNFAAYLSMYTSLKKGDRLAIMMPNLLQYPVVLLGAMRAGLIVVNTNPLYTPRELHHQLADSGAGVIVVLENFAHTLEAIVEDFPELEIITTRIGDCFSFPKSFIINSVVKYVKKGVPTFSLPQATTYKKVLAQGSTVAHIDAELGHDDIAFLQYTGGTTGVAKGAVLTQRNMVANLLQASVWVEGDGIDSSDVFITALPLYHIFSLTANAMFAIKLGATNVLITNPRDLPFLVKQLSTVKFSVVTGVNTLFNALLNTSGFDKLDFSSLTLVLGGGMAVTQSVAKKWQDVTKMPIIEAYGLTETSPAAVINPVNLEAYNGMIGLPISSTEIVIRDENSQEASIGERGELWIRGPQVMKGYWQKPKETAEVMDADGFLRTGDVAIINEQGFVKIVDRIKDMILVSGFNVYPNEIEDIISLNEKVLEVGVIGIPHEISGEAVKVFVVKKDPSLTEDEILECCREKLTGYKRPKVIEFVDELPKSNVGKILRRELRERHNKGL